MRTLLLYFKYNKSRFINYSIKQYQNLLNDFLYDNVFFVSMHKINKSNAFKAIVKLN